LKLLVASIIFSAVTPEASCVVQGWRKLHALSRLPEVKCSECVLLLGSLQSLYREGHSLEEVAEVVTDLCVATALYPDDVCSGMVDVCAEEFMYVLNNTVHSLKTVCDLFFGACDSPMPEWDLEIPGGKPPRTPRVPNEGPRTFRVVQFGDTHTEPRYNEGSNAVCAYPNCCQAEYDEDAEGDGPAPCGRYGNELGKCDVPDRTLEAALAAAVALRPDVVYFSGDIPPHNAWLQTHDYNIQRIRDTTDLLKRYFPDTPIVYSVGNHEAAPVNSFRVPAVYDDGYRMDYLYSVLAEIWNGVGVPEDSLEDVRTGGYYTWLLMPGLRVVSLNTNYGWYQNWWVLMEHEDPTDQLQWLADVLKEAEDNAEKVHIVSHHDPGKMMNSFSSVLNKLLTRFESTVAGVFTGHTHTDELTVSFDPSDNTRPVAVTYLAPSLSSNGDKSPSFRVYEIDGGYSGATFEVVDSLTYSPNLTLANQGADPDFPLAYSAKEAYNLESLSPENWADAAWKMAADDDLLYEYFSHYHSFVASPEEQWAACSAPCRVGLLSGLYAGNAADPEPARRISQHYYASHERGA